MDHPQRDRLAQAQRDAESVRDHLNCRYELIFLLVKSRHYWFDLDAIGIPHATTPSGTISRAKPQAGNAAAADRQSTGRTRSRSVPRTGTARTAATGTTETPATLATCGPSTPAARTAVRTTPGSQSNSRPAASEPAASQAA